MSDLPKRPDEGESTLGNEPASAWETVVPPTPQASAPPQAPQILLPPPAGTAPTVQETGPGGYRQVWDGSAPGTANYGQGYSGGPQGYPAGGANYPPNAPPNYTPPGGYAAPPGGYGGQQQSPYGQQGPYVPPQGQYNSPNMADMLAAGVLFGKGRRWQRRPARLIFWPVILLLIIFVSMLHGCMHLFSW